MDGGTLILILFVAFVIVAAIFGALAARKRREALGQLAARLGLAFNSEENYGLLGKLRQPYELRREGRHLPAPGEFPYQTSRRSWRRL